MNVLRHSTKNKCPTSFYQKFFFPFQQYKNRRSRRPHITLSLTMASRRRNNNNNDNKPKVVRPPEFDTCNFYVEEVSPAFDPKRVLLRRVFFIDEDRTKYVSVGFYPARDYQPLVEFGHVKREKPTILVLADRHVKTLAEILPRLQTEHYGKLEGRQNDCR